jgi:peptidoglycan/xylan/chitin deacetylase (PgdA/CDA1 family)
MIFRMKAVIIAFIIIISSTFALLYEDNKNAIMVINENDDVLYVPILMYHQVKTLNPGKDIITPAEFESDLKYLKENNYSTITMQQLVDYVYKNEPLPEKPIILTFDDGYLSTFKNVYPLLKKYDMKIVLSVIGIDVDNFTIAPSNKIDTALMTWDQIKDLSESGYVELQNHSYNLHSKNKGRLGCAQKSNEAYEEYEKALFEDINKLQIEIQKYTNQTPSTFTYPFGRYSAYTVSVLKKIGFKASLSCDYGVNKITKNPDCLFNLKRACRSHGVSAEKLLTEVYKTVRR